jgi:hypothetical protein
MGMMLTKEIEAMIKIESELAAAGIESLSEKQSARLARVRAELSGIDAANPGIVAHVRKDIEQGHALLGKKNYQQGLSLIRRKLLPLATRTKDGLVVSGADIAKLNRTGAAIGDHTAISLEQNKLCTRAGNGDLLLPWEWDI